jgi:heme/copper-type cytochrome/quinol oxidase subunit 4
MISSRIANFGRLSARTLSLLAILYGFFTISQDSSGWVAYGFVLGAAPILVIGHLLTYINTQNRSKGIKVFMLVLYVTLSLFAVLGSIWQFN